MTKSKSYWQLQFKTEINQNHIGVSKIRIDNKQIQIGTSVERGMTLSLNGTRQFQVGIHYKHIGIKRLSPYSPIFNPIEQAWSILKAGVKAGMAKELNIILAGVDRDSLTLT